LGYPIWRHRFGYSEIILLISGFEYPINSYSEFEGVAGVSLGKRVVATVLSCVMVAVLPGFDLSARYFGMDVFCYADHADSVRVVGFVGDYAIDCPDGVVEIIVQFVTPPAVALRLAGGNANIGRAMGWLSYEKQALSAHYAFMAQLAMLPVPFSAQGDIEIFGGNHQLFNGVAMRVPGFMVEQIASLPEVCAVFPNMTIRAAVLPRGGESAEIAQAAHPFNREARQLFDMDYINTTLGLTGAGITVAVLDTGIYHDHPRFAPFLDTTGRIPGWDFVDNDDDPAEAAYEDYGRYGMTTHGTHVSGTIIAMAPGINLRHYRVLGPGGWGSWADAISGIEAAHASSDIMNLSFGGGFWNHFEPITNAVNLAMLDGTIVVIAAGNMGSWGYFEIDIPVTASLPIAVGAGLAGSYGWVYDDIPAFSGHGPLRQTFHIKPDIIAPGGGDWDSDISIISAIPTFAAYIWPEYFTDESGNAYGHMAGTSMAAPAIAGIAALMLEAQPAAPYEIKARLMNTARPLADIYPPCVFRMGAGFADPIRALTQPAFATTEHYIPFGIIPRHFEPHTMSSLSFGIIIGQPASEPLNITIHNSNGQWHPAIYFFGEHYGVDIIVTQIGENEFTAQMTFCPDMPPHTYAADGFFQGKIVFTDGENRITMPFAAYYTHEAIAEPMIANGIWRPILTNFTLAHPDDEEIRHVPQNRWGQIRRYTSSNITRVDFGFWDITMQDRMAYFYAVDVNDNDNRFYLRSVLLWANSVFGFNFSADELPVGIFEIIVYLENIDYPDEPYIFGIGEFIVTDIRPQIMLDYDMLYYIRGDDYVTISGRIYSPANQIAGGMRSARGFYMGYNRTVVAWGCSLYGRIDWWRAGFANEDGSFQFNVGLADFDNGAISIIAIDGFAPRRMMPGEQNEFEVGTLVSEYAKIRLVTLLPNMIYARWDSGGEYLVIYFDKNPASLGVRPDDFVFYIKTEANPAPTRIIANNTALYEYTAIIHFDIFTTIPAHALFVATNAVLQNVSLYVAFNGSQKQVYLADMPDGRAIVISPQFADIGQGRSQQFYASVIHLSGLADQEVVWSISGEHSAETQITDCGILTICIFETAKYISILAESPVYIDLRQSITAAITPNQIAKEIIITPSYPLIDLFHNAFVGVEVFDQHGEKIYNPNLVWGMQFYLWGSWLEWDSAVTGTSFGAIISADFLLDTAIDVIATWSDSLDPNLTASASLEISFPYYIWQNLNRADFVNVYPRFAILSPGDYQVFYAVVHGDPKPPQWVSWAVREGFDQARISHDGV